MFDGKAFGEEMVSVVKAYVDRATAPLLARICDLETRLAEATDRDEVVDAPMVGHMVASAVADAVAAAVADAVAKMPAPSAAPIDAVAIEQAVADAMSKIPPPTDGVSVTVADVAPMIGEEVAKAVANLPKPPAIDEAAIERAVADAVDRIPPPADGVSVTVADVAPMISEEVAKAVAAIPPPQDGIGAASALIDRAGELVLTLTNGEVRNLGPVVGKDADQNAVERMVSEAVAQIPVPKDGQDALGFDDMQFEHDGERCFTLKFVRGDQIKAFAFRVPVTIYRGVWREGDHEKGDAVTWGGSLWIAQKDTDAKPDSGDGWQLAVKRGRDSKEPTAR